jgi:transcriptional regulator with PAS, ATPase and Fis domain
MVILFSWLGITDLKACDENSEEQEGPIACTIKQLKPDNVYLLSDHKEAISKKYQKWLASKTKAEIIVESFYLSSPTNHTEIYESCLSTLAKHYTGEDGESVYYLLSAGTPAMSSIWLMLSKTKYPANLLESSKESGIKEVNLPFELTLDYLPHRTVNKKIPDFLTTTSQAKSEFESIIHCSDVMKIQINRGVRLAKFSIPVLITGESGTGKELFAHAIHNTSERAAKAIVAVNCGSIPSELFESEFFGHVKGAFTGAHKETGGYLQMANYGTLFLDEIGEMPMEMQVKLLRVLQEAKYRKVGGTKELSVDVRIIAATNRNLYQEVLSNNFREDLFHRLAVGIIELPALRDRREDIDSLVDHLLNEINMTLSENNLYIHKKISGKAKEYIRHYGWPGNIRELKNTLMRASIWAESEELTYDDIKSAIINDEYNNRDLYEIYEGFSIDREIEAVITGYLLKALEMSGGNKSETARMLGVANYQTISNWIRKFNIKLA